MVTPRGVWSRREGRRTEERGLMEFYYSLIDLLWRPEWTLCSTLSLTLISKGEGGRAAHAPLLCVPTLTPPLFSPLPSCPSLKTRLAAVWQADAAGGHFGSLWAERSPWQMRQLSSPDLQGEPFICLLMEGHVQHHKGGVSCGDQQPSHGRSILTACSLPATPTRGPKQLVNTWWWWWGTRSCAPSV